MLARQALELVVVDGLGGEVEAVGHEVIQLAGEIDRAAMREVAALVQAHTQDGVAGLDERGVGGEVGVGAAVGLDVGKSAAKELACAVAREVLCHVDALATSVVTVARIAFGVFVGKDAAHGLDDGGAGEVLGRDEFDGLPLADELIGNGRCDGGIGDAQRGCDHAVLLFIAVRSRVTVPICYPSAVVYMHGLRPITPFLRGKGYDGKNRWAADGPRGHGYFARTAQADQQGTSAEAWNPAEATTLYCAHPYFCWGGTMSKRDSTLTVLTRASPRSPGKTPTPGLRRRRRTS